MGPAWVALSGLPLAELLSAWREGGGGGGWGGGREALLLLRLVQTEAAVRGGEAMPAAWGQTMSVRPNQAKPNQCLVCTRSSQGQGGGGEGSDLDLQRGCEQAGK